MTDITIPPEAWRAAMSAYHKTIRKDPGNAWQAACLAMLRSWPEMVERHYPNDPTRLAGIFLPLTENTND
jgi:hypothetical protein